MNLFPSLLLIFFLNAYESATLLTAKGDVSINCGSTVTRRPWQGDLHQLKGSSTTSMVTDRNTILPDDRIPYETARISSSAFSYLLQVSPGPKLIRFHFNPSPYKGFKRSNDLFSVKAGAFTLLSNFSASLTAVNYIVKEFCIYIEENQLLDIIFSPESGRYAFINGIEAIALPLSRSYFHVGDVGIQLVGKSSVYIDKSTALELIDRVTIRKAPIYEVVDNESWRISVDVGFRYLIRLHLSRLGFKMAEMNGYTFEVRINGVVADTNINIDEAGGIPLYKDYVVAMKGSKAEGKRYVSICLHRSNDELMEGNGPVLGFEVLKLSNSDNSLASPILRLKQNTTYCGIMNVNVVITFMLLVNIVIYLVHLMWEANHKVMALVKVDLPCRYFSLAEIELATTNFSYANFIGKGGFGKVYKGCIDNGERTVAIKRLKSSSRQGEHEFLTEIETLSRLRHVNLVPLIGYCNERKEMILVYEYMLHGTLADHLWRRCNDDTLSWKQRLNICIGAGRGLDYLHTGHSIVHRDVKASNILLDNDFVAKVSDFGLAKPLDRSKLESHVSTKVKGTPGYYDPDYIATGKLSRHSDTFAFGVMLLEVLSERRALDRWAVEDEQILSKWGLENIDKRKGDKIVASCLKDEITQDSLDSFLGIVKQCLNDDPKKRPTMAKVVVELEHTLELQDSGKSPVREENVYLAKRAEHAERYEDMVEFMQKAIDALNGDDMSVEERNLLSVSYKNVISARRASWRIISSIEQKEVCHGNEGRASIMKLYRSKIESELSSICDRVLNLLNSKLIPGTGNAESKVFFLKMKGDYHRYMAEFKTGEDHKVAVDNTRWAYEYCRGIASVELAPTHPVRLGLALNLAVFYYDILDCVDEACNVAQQAIDEARGSAELEDNLMEDTSLIMNILGDNLELWTETKRHQNND